MLKTEMIPRIVKDENDENKWSKKTEEEKEQKFQEVYKAAKEEGKNEYEDGFTQQFFECFELDDFLKKFYIRFVFECDNARKIIKKIKNKEISEDSFDFLKQTCINMKNAETQSELAMEDCIFHRWLFCTAGLGHFFNWYDTYSQDLKSVLDKFWENVNKKGIYSVEELVDMHENIMNQIIAGNEKEAIEAIEKHFSIVLLQSLGVMQTKVLE